MAFDDFLFRVGARLKPLHYLGLSALFLVAVLLALLANREPTAVAPAVQALVPAAKASAATVQAGPQWQELNATQKKILRPLAGTWNALGQGHKAKWLALTNSYPNRTPEEQAKLQSRMADWAALTPAERERARLNFAETKKLSPSNRAAEWAAYQELSSAEKQRLAEKGAGKPAGAAVAVTPVPQDKLTAVPITRRTGTLPESSAIAKPNLDPNTLLPRAAAPAAPASAATEVPSAPAGEASTPAINSDTLSPN